MKELQNNFTTSEQSKRLLELGVPADSADCYYGKDGKIHHIDGSIPNSLLWTVGCTPCWSVGRMMEIIAECYQVDMPFRYFVRGGMMESLINTFIELREELDFSKLED